MNVKGADESSGVIFLADGYRPARRMLAEALGKAGYRVIGMSAHPRALKALMSVKALALIIDLDSAYCGGLATVAAAKRATLQGGIKVIGITAHREKDSLIKAVKGGVDQILLKERVTIRVILRRLAVLSAQAEGAKERWQPAYLAVKAAKGERPAVMPIKAISDKVRYWASANPLQHSARQVLRMLNEGTATPATLASLVRNDVEVGTKLVVVANSPAYKRENTVIKTSTDAMRLLGPAVAVNVALCVGMHKYISPPVAGEDVLPGLWGHSLATAICAEALARYAKWCDPGQAFAMGLLHDVGRRWLAEQMLRYYGHVLTTPVDVAGAEGLCAIETAVVGVDHTWVGGKLMEGWGLGPVAAKVVSGHDIGQANLDEWRSQASGLLKTVVLADAMASGFGYEADGMEEMATVPRWWTAQIVGQLEFREQTYAALKDQMLMYGTVCDGVVRVPDEWKGAPKQIVVACVGLSPIDPLQHVVTHAYPDAAVRSGEMAKVDEPQTLLLIDLRESESGEGATSVAKAMAAVPAAVMATDWPAVVVTGESPEAIKGLLGERKHVVVPRLVRLGVLQAAVESMLCAEVAGEAGGSGEAAAAAEKKAA